MSWTLIYAFVSCVILLVGRIFYIVLIKDRKHERKRSKSVKTLIVLGSGGHTTEILQIVKNLNFQRYTPRTYVHADTDKISSSKVHDVETIKNTDFQIIEISRSREVGQSYVASIWTTLVSLKESALIFWLRKPDLILCNGPGTCVPICVAAFLWKVMFFGETTIIFIESYCRVKTYSLSGKILYYIADSVIVQWPQLCKNEKKKHVHLIK